jgi:hypothetical protein
MTLKRQAREQQLSGKSQQRNTYGDYQPNFNNRQFIAKVTRLSVNNTQIAHTSDPSAWIVGSAANTFIMPLKERLHNYRHFEQEVQVKGFDGKPEMAVGSGSITLTDHRGNRQTLNDVVYVPECSEQILSLMKLRRLYSADFAFTSLEEFPSKQRILPWKISQRCTLHLGINISRLQCCNHTQRLQKAKNRQNPRRCRRCRRCQSSV